MEGENKRRIDREKRHLEAAISHSPPDLLTLLKDNGLFPLSLVFYLCCNLIWSQGRPFYETAKQCCQFIWKNGSKCFPFSYWPSFRLIFLHNPHTSTVPGLGQFNEDTELMSSYYYKPYLLQKTYYLFKTECFINIRQSGEIVWKMYF